MKIKNIEGVLTKEDILNFSTLQDKIEVDEVIINKKVYIRGHYRIMVNVNFEMGLELTGVENNKIYIGISSFKISNSSMINSIATKALKHIIKSFTELKGISFENDKFKIDVFKFIDSHYKGEEIKILSEAEVREVLVKNKEIEVSFGGIEINLEKSSNLIY